MKRELGLKGSVVLKKATVQNPTNVSLFSRFFYHYTYILAQFQASITEPEPAQKHSQLFTAVFKDFFFLSDFQDTGEGVYENMMVTQHALHVQNTCVCVIPN